VQDLWRPYGDRGSESHARNPARQERRTIELLKLLPPNDLKGRVTRAVIVIAGTIGSLNRRPQASNAAAVTTTLAAKRDWDAPPLVPRPGHYSLSPAQLASRGLAPPVAVLVAIHRGPPEFISVLIRASTDETVRLGQHLSRTGHYGFSLGYRKSNVGADF
jgi:hypothetical protein